MRISYYEGKNLSLAEVNKITCSGALLICQLKSPDSEGRPEVVIRPLPNEEVCEQFFREVICTSGSDAVINLENTNFDTRLGAMFDELDALYED